jgi:serine/threonine protein kinase
MQTNKTSKPTKKASFKVFQPGELILDGKYEIVKKIGEGGMSSVVYLAKNLTIKKDTYFDYKKMHVAVKVITKTKDVDEAD